MGSDVSDAELVRLIQFTPLGKGTGTEALNELLRRHYPWILRLCMFEARDQQEAYDFAQEALIAIAKGLPSFRGESSLTTWMYTVVKRSARRARGTWLKKSAWRVLRQQGGDNEPSAVERVPSPEVPADAALEFSETSRLLFSYVKKLSPAQRDAILFHYFEGLSVEDAALRMNCSVSSLKTHLFRARNKLRGFLESAPEEEREVFSLR